MSETYRFRVEKLIRDGLPAIMRASGLRVFERRLDPADHVVALKQKLCEEAAEVATAKSTSDLAEELADVLEVILALAKTNGLSIDDIEMRRREKEAQRGSFDCGIYNAAVEGEADCPAIQYYLDRPGQYPRI